MEHKTKDLLLGSAAVLTAYFFLIVNWIISREFAHTYQHWLEGASLQDLPVLTIYALPLIGFENVSTTAAVLSTMTWLVLSACPAVFMVIFLRSSREIRMSILSISLVGWLFLLLSILLFTAFGLWLPFSLL